MSYEDLVAARATRLEKEAAKMALKKRKSKKSDRGSAATSQIADTPHYAITPACRGGTETAPAIAGNEAQTGEDLFEGVPFRALVASMY